MARVKDNYRELSGPQKAAIFMLSLGEAQAAKLFRKMDDEEIRNLSHNMALLGTVKSGSSNRCSSSSPTICRRPAR